VADIRVKDIEVWEQLFEVPLHPLLLSLFKWIAERYTPVVITCGYLHKKFWSVHGTYPLRALDIRSWVYPFPQTVCNNINAAWEYDHTRPNLKCAVYHNVGHGLHIHLQVHDNTKKRE